MKLSLTWIASCRSDTTMPATTCKGTVTRQFRAVMRKRRQRSSTRGVSAAQMYHSLAANRNSRRKLSGRLRDSANTCACAATARTIRVHARRMAPQVRKRRECLEREATAQENHTPWTMQFQSRMRLPLDSQKGGLLHLLQSLDQFLREVIF